MAERRETLASLALLAALALWPLAAHALGEPYYVNLATRVAILALAGVGLNLALGFGGMVSFGHAAFFGLGGYVAGIGAHHAFEGTDALSWPLALPGTDHAPTLWLIAMGVSGLAALAMGAVSLRTRGVYFIMITLALAQMVYYFAVAWPTYGGEDGLPIYLRNRVPGVESDDPLTFFFLCFGALALSLLLCRTILNARFGAALAMARINEARLSAAGMDPFPVRLAAFTLSAMLTGLAGALFADLNGFVSPSMLDWARSGEIMIFVILGGVGRLCGPVAGAAAFVLLESVLGGYTEHWRLFLGLILLGAVLFARGGLMALLAGAPRHD